MHPMKPLHLFKTENDMVSLIAAKYNRSEKSLHEDVISLNKWMRTQPHLPEILDDGSIQNFLILNKCSVEKAKKSIDMYYTLRTQIPDMYENLNPSCSSMKEMMEIEGFVPLPKLTEDMYRVLVWKLLKKNLVDKLKLLQIVGMAWNMQEVRLREDIIYGDILVFDMAGTNLGLMTQVTSSFVVKSFSIYEKIYSTPLKALYFVNAPSFVSMMLTILKSVLKPKLFDRIQVCEDTSILTKNFPKEILPKDYGGLEKSVEELNELVNTKLSEYQDRFDRFDKLKIDESLRPDMLKNDELLGFHGNFKKLNVD